MEFWKIWISQNVSVKLTRNMHAENLLPPVHPLVDVSGPQAQVLPVICLTLPWPRPLACYCRSV